jgi:hypothetical protein
MPAGRYLFLLHSEEEIMNDNYIDLMKYVFENNDEMVCGILKNNPKYLLNIPSEKRKEEYVIHAISWNSSLFDELDDNEKTLRVCEIAVKREPENIQYVPEHIKTEEFILQMIDKDGYVISFIDNPTEEMCLRAMNSYFYAIFCIKNPTEKMMLLASGIQGLYNSYQNRPQYYNAVLAYVKKYGASLKHIKRKFKTYEVCKAAIDSSRYAIKFVNKSTLRKHPDLLDLATKKWGKD